MRALYHCALLLAATTFAACHKTKKTTTPDPPVPVTTGIANGIGDNPSAIHGYMFAGYSNSSSDGSYGSLSEYCTFRDPSADLMQNYDHYVGSEIVGAQTDKAGNINAGQVTFNELPLLLNLNNLFISYRNNGSTITYTAGLTANWHTDGNGSFKSMDLRVPRGFPKFNSDLMFPITAHAYTITVSQGFTVNLSNIASNYDSLAIFVGGINWSNSVHHTVTPNAPVASFSSNELAPFSNYGTIGISFVAFNYSHKTIEDKLYVFELANTCTTMALIQP